MALRFCIKPCNDTIKFTVKGVEMEFSYHAASALCTQIAEVLIDRLGDTMVHPYWKMRLEQKWLVNVHKKNKESYADFLDRHGNPELEPAPRRRKREPQHEVEKKPLCERRKDERQRFVEFWQKRLSKYQGETPSQLSTSVSKDAHRENKDCL